MMTNPQINAVSRLWWALHLIDGSDMVYVENPKVACSNIKWSLITQFCPSRIDSISDVHTRRQTPFSRDLPKIARAIAAEEVDVFSIVRNPRARFLSAYVDKIGVPESDGSVERDQYVWQEISHQLRLDSSKTYSPEAVLDRMLRTSKSEVDRHISPQVRNLFWGEIKYSTIFYLEDLGEGEVLVMPRGKLEMANFKRNSVSGRSKRVQLSDEALQMIDDYYQEDYSAFGYTPGLSEPGLSEGFRVSSLMTSNQRFLRMVASGDYVAAVEKEMEGSGAPLSRDEALHLIDKLADANALGRLGGTMFEKAFLRSIAMNAEALERLHRRARA